MFLVAVVGVCTVLYWTSDSTDRDEARSSDSDH
jgi:hypothetical protein